MCGIYCTVSSRHFAELDTDAAVLLSCRGPDACDTHRIKIQSNSQKWFITFASSVLSLRGSSIQVQPVIDQTTGSVFCWNGEAWLLNDEEITVNDTQLVFQHLLQISRNAKAEVDHSGVVSALTQIKGPFAFVYYDALTCRLYYGRDVLGRRSLLVNDLSIDSYELTIASAAFANDKANLVELPTPFIFTIDLNQAILVPESLPLNCWSPAINHSIPEDSTAISNLPTDNTINVLLHELRRSIKLRVQAVPTYNRFEDSSRPSRIAVLFSGGLDCTLLARLVHDILPLDESVDLLNVAFENPRVINARANEKEPSRNSGVSNYESCPDRLTGRSSFAELRETCPTREWRFVAVDIPYGEFLDHRQRVIQLMKPHNTEMDLSITAALYFAARGQGQLSNSSNNATISYTTSARVLLSGLGADELFAGYARHAAAFARGGYAALNDELELDYKRIGSRNLGRDDRVISHWARETRYPFLDEDFVEFALGLPGWEKCGFRPGKTIPKHFENTASAETREELHPEKMLLRCALWQLGMKKAAAEKKRAIQFGARTAKMHAGRTKGTDLIT